MMINRKKNNNTSFLNSLRFFPAPGSKEQMVAGCKKHWAFLLFLTAMAIYYGIRMFKLDPWYDELYTYYSFISKGPIYSAIHWPVPNNHVMYSVVSAFLNIFGNPYLSLRGISFLSSLSNLTLLYLLCNKFSGRLLSLSCVAFYSGLYLVNSLSIQGRGYTMAITFYLLSLLMLFEICVNKKNHWLYYALFSLSLTWGLYTITSNLYWVLPTCFVGGFYLLVLKDFKRLGKLVISSIIAAVHTFCLYTLIWLAIGSNLLSKTADSGFYGLWQVTIILKAPFKAFLTGMNYMLASPYVQSMDRNVVISEFIPWVTGLFNQYIVNSGRLILLFLLLLLCITIFLIISEVQGTLEVPLFFHIYSVVTLGMIPLILIVQSVQPYHRVFTFLGVTLSITLFSAIPHTRAMVRGIKWELPLCILFLTFCCFNLCSPYYRAPYADRESKVKEVLWQSGKAEHIENICFMDDYQKYVLQFFYDIRPTEAAFDEAQYILLPREITDKNYTAKTWPILYTYDEINWSHLSNYEVITETKDYIFYYKNK